MSDPQPPPANLPTRAQWNALQSALIQTCLNELTADATKLTAVIAALNSLKDVSDMVGGLNLPQ